MARGERPLEPGDDVVVQFARDLRLLREKAGSPTYRELSTRAHYSPAALSEAASGHKLPSLSVTKAYVAGCGGDTVEWEARWRTTAAELAIPKTVASDEGDGDQAPYVGLAAFQQEDASRFFGRDTLATELLTRLRQHRFLGVFGASGCGKSSLLRAGIAARLAADRKTDSAPVVVFTPGEHPIEECAIHLARFLSDAPGTLRDQISADPRNLHLRIRQAVTDSRSESDVVLVVDQFEELFTLCRDEPERVAFVDALVTATTDPASRTRVVLGVRADFLGHCGQYARLVSALRDAQVLVGPMTTEELRLAITGPAEQAGYRVEGALIARLIADASKQSGTLPLISHALLQTWQRRQGKLMNLASYEAVGGIEHALARTAEQTYQSLDPDQQNLAQQVFLRLTALGEGTEDTKRRVPRDELHEDNPHTARMLDTLTQARLITVGHDSVEIVHEALIRHWPRLQDWLEADRDGHHIHRHLTDAATEWERHERDEGMLYRGTRLAAWQDRAPERLNDTEREFLTASRRAETRERRTRRRRLRLVIGGLSTGTTLIAVLAVIALVLAVRADNQRDAAIGRQLVYDARTQLPLDPELALLLAREAYTITPNDDSEAVLRQATVNSRIRASLPGPPGPQRRQDTVTGVAFSPNGKHLVASGRGELRMWDWDFERGACATPRIFKGRAGVEMSPPVFSSNGRRIAAGDGSGYVWIWDIAGSSEPVRLRGVRGRTLALVFSPDGQRLAVSQGGIVFVWNTVDDHYTVVLREYTGPTTDLAFSSDGKQLIDFAGVGNLRTWNIASNTILNQSPVYLGHNNDAEFSPDGRHVVTASADDGQIDIWDKDSADASAITIGTHEGAASDVAYSNDGHWIASTGDQGTVKIWNATKNERPTVLKGHHGLVRAAAFSPDGRSVATAGEDGTVKIWDVDEGQILNILRGQPGLATSNTANLDGRKVVTGGRDGTVRVWDLAKKAVPVVLDTNGGSVVQVMFSPDERRLAAASDDDGTLFIWDTRDFAAQVRLHTSYNIDFRFDFSPDGERIATTNGHKDVLIWNVDGTGEPRRLHAGLPDLFPVSETQFDVAWSPEGHRIAASHDDTVTIWDLRTYIKQTLPKPDGPATTLDFSPDGDSLIGGGKNGKTYLWNLAAIGRPTELRQHDGAVTRATFSSDGKHVITAGTDNTIRIWNPSSRSEPLVLKEFRATVDNVLPLNSNRYITTHDDGTIRIWRCHACVSIANVLADVHQHVTRELTTEERRVYMTDST